jgi:hypothetical protein
VARNPGDPMVAASLEGVNFPLSGLKVAWYIPSEPRPPVPKKISIGLAETEPIVKKRKIRYLFIFSTILSYQRILFAVLARSDFFLILD